MLIKLARLLKSKGLTVTVAESCTGGLLSSTLTNLSGSSHYFKLGIVAYSNAAKASLLKIPMSIINKHGAVSQEVCSLMAKQARRIGKADIGIGVTGIAGPSGGTKQNPVGTVFIAIACKNCLSLKKYRFSGNRLNIKRKSVEAALKLLTKCLDSFDYSDFK